MIHPYATESYANIFSNMVGTPIAVPEWRSWVLRRPIGDGAVYDATGGYPVAAIDRAADIAGGIARLRRLDLVSVVFVADPFLRPPLEALENGLDVVRPFKAHYLHDNSLGPPRYSKHHRHALRQAGATVRRIDLAANLSAWIALYRDLVARRRITGPAAFSDTAFRRLAALPGLTCFGAYAGDRLVACHLWLDDGRRAHSHLAASNSQGYANGAAYLLYDAAIRHFTHVETIDFGGAAGFRDDRDNGLARFKRGFSNRVETAYLCGAVLDVDRYAELCATKDMPKSGYFPAYRRAREENRE